MKVSVVMTTYNGEKYLCQMLDSLRMQERKIDELLFFDDKSTDGTVCLIEDYIKRYDIREWRVVVNKKNLGWEKNFTQGINFMTPLNETKYMWKQVYLRWHLLKHCIIMGLEAVFFKMGNTIKKIENLRIFVKISPKMSESSCLLQSDIIRTSSPMQYRCGRMLKMYSL